MRPIVEKVLKSGLIDKAMVEYMEKTGMLPEGAADSVQEDALKDATKEHLATLTESLAVELEKEHAIRETHLDLERIRWPAVVDIWAVNADQSLEKSLVIELPAAMDRMGRYFFRFDDVKAEWFVPGYRIYRKTAGRETVHETILESQPLYINDVPICIQVTVMKA